VTTTAIQGSQAGKNGSSATGAAAGAPLVLVESETGITLIPQPTDLTRLNYYDGKFLRAADLSAEQAYVRSLSALSNRAGGPGIVFGFDVSSAGGGTLGISAGLAIDPNGRVLSMPYDATVNLRQLIERSQQAAGQSSTQQAGGETFAGCAPETVANTPGGTGLTPNDLYVISVSWAEALCGESDVYGRLCEDACISSTDRPFRLEGVVVRATPVILGQPSCTGPGLTAKHRRSLAASAWFADERRTLGAEMSGSRLRSGPWCQGATAITGDSVPLALVSVTGETLLFLDEWTVRRERIEMPPLRYWQWQLAMRPRAVFLAQLLQFQCQLSDVLTGTPPVNGGDDPCAQQLALLKRAHAMLEEMKAQYGTAEMYRREKESGGDRPQFLTSLTDLSYEVGTTLTQLDELEQSRVLLEGGIVELPSAGYLPVAPGPVDVKTQVQRLMGEGVELRVCSVRPDYVPHALEEAQHMDRICLLQGLADPQNRPRVDVLVPDGLVTDATVEVGGIPLQVKIAAEVPEVDPERPWDTAGTLIHLSGAGRAEVVEGGGFAFHFAGRAQLDERVRQRELQATPMYPEGQTVVAAAPGVKSPMMAESDASLTAAKAEYRASREPASDALLRIFGGLADGGAGGGVYACQGTVPLPQSPPQATPFSPPEQSPPDREAGYRPAVWATVRVAGNPFALAAGEGVPLHGEFAVSFGDDGGESGNQEIRAAQVTVDADLVRDQGIGNTLTGHAQGSALLRIPGQTPEWTSATVPVDLTFAPAQGGGTLTVSFVPDEENPFTLTAQWTPRPTTVTLDGEVDWIAAAVARLEQRGEDTQGYVARVEKEYAALDLHHLRVLHGTAVENAEVLKPGNAYHERAVAALSELQALLAEPGFRAAGETKLFAPDREVRVASAVRATRDWVLFHRRRDNSCDCACAHDDTKVLRRYRVYHAKVPVDTTLAQVREAVRGTTPVPGMATVPVLPRYAADDVTLLSLHGEVLNAWTGMDLGSEIVYGAIASAGVGAADAGALLDGRLESFAEVVDDATPDPRAVYEVLTSVPPTLDASGLDGVMVLITQAAPPKTVCHAVYALPDQGTMDSVIRAISSGADLGQWLQERLLLGQPKFQQGTATTQEPLSPLLDKWNQFYPGLPVRRAITVVPSGTPAPAVAEQQGEVIAKTAFGVALTEGGWTTAETGVFTTCPAITLLEPGSAIPQTTCQAVYVIDRAAIAEKIDPATGTTQDVIELAISTAKKWMPMDFEAGTANLVTSQADIDTVFGTQAVGSYIAVVGSGATADETKLADQQAAAAAAAVGKGKFPGAPIVSQNALSGPCPTVTLLDPMTLNTLQPVDMMQPMATKTQPGGGA
jgi:hypothetical protein